MSEHIYDFMLNSGFLSDEQQSVTAQQGFILGQHGSVTGQHGSVTGLQGTVTDPFAPPVEEPEEESPTSMIAAVIDELRDGLKHRPAEMESTINIGLLCQLVQCASGVNGNAIQQKSILTLGDIVIAYPDKAADIAFAGAIPLLVENLKSPDEAICTFSTWTLYHIIGESSEWRDIAIKAGVIPEILRMTRYDTPIKVLMYACRLMRDVCKTTPPMPIDKLTLILMRIRDLLHHANEEVELLMLSCLTSITCSDCDAVMRYIINTGILHEIMKRIRHEKMCKLIVRVLINMTSINNEITQHVLNHKVLDHMKWLIRNKDKEILRLSLRLASNILDTSVEQVETFVKNELVTDILKLLLVRDDVDTLTEAVTAISTYSSSAEVEQIYYIVTQGVLMNLSKLIDHDNIEIVLQAMDAIEKIMTKSALRHDCMKTALQEVGFVEKLEAYKSQGDDKLQSLATAILENHFLA